MVFARKPIFRAGTNPPQRREPVVVRKSCPVMIAAVANLRTYSPKTVPERSKILIYEDASHLPATRG